MKTVSINRSQRGFGLSLYQERPCLLRVQPSSAAAIAGIKVSFNRCKHVAKLPSSMIYLY